MCVWVRSHCGPRLRVDRRSEVLKMAGSSGVTVEDQIRVQINEKYLGSKDVEVNDSIDEDVW